MTLHVCRFSQVELLIENEAEKDYLYDVLRMYHQWVQSVTQLIVYVVQRAFCCLFIHLLNISPYEWAVDCWYEVMVSLKQ